MLYLQLVASLLQQLEVLPLRDHGLAEVDGLLPLRPAVMLDWAVMLGASFTFLDFWRLPEKGQ
jgi:hypothetical protein